MTLLCAWRIALLLMSWRRYISRFRKRGRCSVERILVVTKEHFVKQQLSSLEYVDGLIRKKLVILTNNTVDNGGLDVVRALSSEDGLVQLPLHVILTNAVAVSYFIDYLQTVGGQNYIDLYLAIEVYEKAN
ncbi:sorting nexin 13 [Parelaphostrongylus tenuis]|uniref:Sorting nexin 13 n=1 Tax=Parelaphostrongylus tenuis TaxID=148309 RepID=A0AAD5WL69_PARTN|nr:sorting nexin 13 [Parelaphostrongylus tenuis]